MTQDELMKLAKRCELADGPDQELGLAISVACDMATPHLCPTSSLDAAMTLTQDKWIGITGPHLWKAEVGGIAGWGATAALALCAAALRARAKGGNHEG